MHWGLLASTRCAFKPHRVRKSWTCIPDWVGKDSYLLQGTTQECMHALEEASLCLTPDGLLQFEVCATAC